MNIISNDCFNVVFYVKRIRVLSIEEFITSVEKIRRRNAHVLNSKNNKKWILSLDENKCKYGV